MLYTKFTPLSVCVNVHNVQDTGLHSYSFRGPLRCIDLWYIRTKIVFCFTFPLDNN